MIHFQDERDVDRYVENRLKDIGLVLKNDFNDQHNMSAYLKEALKGSSKTENKTGTGVPDFTVEKYKIPVIIENKSGLKKLQKLTKDGISRSDSDIQNFAVNGAVSYARHMIHSGKYDSVIAIGIAGDTNEDLSIAVYYVFGFEGEPKLMSGYTTLNFLENDDSFRVFIADATLTEEEKHEILIKSQEELHFHANKLNKLMNGHSIGVAERVIYISGMLLSMQDIVDDNGETILEGLAPKEINGKQTENHRDGVKILAQIDEYLTNKGVLDNKKRLMLSSFDRISIDADRDKFTELSPLVSKNIKGSASITRQVFQYVYDNVFTKISGTAGHLDIIGEMYSIFLKYALGDGKEIGIVLTPPYITKLMAQILGINKDSRVLDVAAGSAGFLIACMGIMIEQANKEYGKGTTSANEKIKLIKNTQLMGIERDSQMYTLAATNMIMRGDGSAKIEKGSSFDQPKQLYEDFNATALLLNPPFTYIENGMPFLAFGLKYMKKGGKAAVIIQDSAGSGKAVKSNKEILRNNRLLASIKMPADLFVPYAGVQTSIYVFEAQTPHNFKTDIVKFIDFRQDGYKRTKRSINETDSPKERYSDISIIFNMGLNADKNSDFHKELWDLSEIYIEDTITDSGADWNFEQHKKIDTRPSKSDFSKTVENYLEWEVSQLIKNGFNESEAKENLKKMISPTHDNAILNQDVHWGKFKIGDLFDIAAPKAKFNADKIKFGGKHPYVARGEVNNGIRGWIDEDECYLNDADTISFGQDTATMFYQETPYFTGDKIKIFTLKNRNLNYLIASFIITAMKKSFSNFSWGSSSYNVTILEQVIIMLPVTSADLPDFDYMEAYINHIENEYIANKIREFDLKINAAKYIIQKRVQQ